MTTIQQLQETLGYIAWRVAVIGQHIQDIPDADRQIIYAKVGDILKVIKSQQTDVMLIDYEAKMAYDKVQKS